MKNKNIWLLPTNKPSKIINSGKEFNLLLNSTIDKRCVNIYIISDEETLSNNGDYYLGYPNYTTIHKWNMVGVHEGKQTWIKKIILTTDQDLIKDGVQAIDDEFLEWFIKNPSCEWVEIENYPDYEFNMYGYYGIIIPKEENFYDELVKYFKTTPREKVLEDWNKSAHLDNVGPTVDEFLENTNKQQETLEQAAERFLKDGARELKTGKQVLIAFAKWQNERMYSGEEVLRIITELKSYLSFGDEFNEKEWFEQFKKK